VAHRPRCPIGTRSRAEAEPAPKLALPKRSGGRRGPELVERISSGRRTGKQRGAGFSGGPKRQHRIATKDRASSRAVLSVMAA